MVEASYRKGLTDFGISGHADFSFCLENFGMTDQALKQYKEELYRLREEYAGKMNLYIGIELDCLGPVQKAEYAIGSTHCVLKNGEYVEIDDSRERLTEAVGRLWNGDWYALARDYYEWAGGLSSTPTATKRTTSGVVLKRRPDWQRSADSPIRWRWFPEAGFAQWSYKGNLRIENDMRKVLYKWRWPDENAQPVYMSAGDDTRYNKRKMEAAHNMAAQ